MPNPLATKILARGLLGSLVAAGLGAAALGLLSSATGRQLPFMAWVIGALVGTGARLAGGRGRLVATFAVLIGIAGMLGGRMLAVRLALDQAAEAYALENFGGKLTPDQYDAWAEDAALFAKLESVDEYARFMVDREYTTADAPEEVTATDLAGFRERDVPVLEALHRDKLSFEQWRTFALRRIRESVLARLTWRDLYEAAVEDVRLVVQAVPSGDFRDVPRMALLQTALAALGAINAALVPLQRSARRRTAEVTEPSPPTRT